MKSDKEINKFNRLLNRLENLSFNQAQEWIQLGDTALYDESERDIELVKIELNQMFDNGL